MASGTAFDHDGFNAGGDKDDLIAGDEKPVFGKGGHILASSPSFTSEGNNKNESSPLHRMQQKPIYSGKDASHSRGLRIIILSVVLVAFVITVALILSIVLGEPEVGGNAGVATDVPECSDMGVTIMRKGGNAVDAAVASMFCVGVVNGQSSGIGGGGFMLIHDHKTHKSKVYDFREVAPGSANAKVYENLPSGPLMGGLSVGVPGELRGMQAAHTQHGALSWKSVVQPAADLARNGFKVTKSMAAAFTEGKVKVDDFKGLLRDTYVRDGKFVTEGTIIKRPELADTLDIIASNGDQAFYQGELSQSIVDAVSKAGGNITLKDLREYTVKIRNVVETKYDGHTIISAPVPASGPVLLFVMNVLEGFDYKHSDVTVPLTYHRFIETLKLVYPEQQMLGDPGFDKTDSVKNATRKLLSKKEAEKLSTMIKNITMVTDETGNADGRDISSLDSGTSHISIIDTQELMVSVTTTVNYWFGSKIMTDTGILLNNQLDDFFRPKKGTSAKTQANVIAPGKRPMSNMSPTVVVNEAKPCALRLVIGAANGSRIIAGIAEVLLNVLSFAGPRTTLSTAVGSPRLYYDPIHQDTEYEESFDTDIVNALAKMGHVMHEVLEGINIVQAVEKVNNSLQAVSDIRKWGKAATLVPSNS